MDSKLQEPRSLYTEEEKEDCFSQVKKRGWISLARESHSERACCKMYCCRIREGKSCKGALPREPD